jgi:hypothetical protein
VQLITLEKVPKKSMEQIEEEIRKYGAAEVPNEDL